MYARIFGIVTALALITSSQSAGAEQAPAAQAPQGLKIDASDFECLQEMTAVRHFFVDNLLGDIEATVAVAQSTDGGTYPPGSVVQLIPTEVMVKHQPGWNAATGDWEFFELDLSAKGSSIRNRGFTDVVNQFGGNCFARLESGRAEPADVPGAGIDLRVPRYDA